MVKNILGFQTNFYSTKIREQFLKIILKNYFSKFFQKQLSNKFLYFEKIIIPQTLKEEIRLKSSDDSIEIYINNVDSILWKFWKENWEMISTYHIKDKIWESLINFNKNLDNIIENQFDGISNQLQYLSIKATNLWFRVFDIWNNLPNHNPYRF